MTDQPKKIIFGIILLLIIALSVFLFELGGYTNSKGWVHDWDGEVYRVDSLEIQVNPASATSTIQSLAQRFDLHVTYSAGGGLYFVDTPTHTRKELHTLSSHLDQYPNIIDTQFDWAVNLN